MRKHLVKNFIFLLISVGVLLAVFGFHELTTGTLSLSFYDTYYVTDTWPVCLIIFIVLGFTGYLSSESVILFKDKPANLVLLGFTLLLLFVIFFYNRSTGEFFSNKGGWVVYPPNMDFKTKVLPRLQNWWYLVLFSQIILSAFAVFLIYRSFFDKRLRGSK